MPLADSRKDLYSRELDDMRQRPADPEGTLNQTTAKENYAVQSELDLTWESHKNRLLEAKLEYLGKFHLKGEARSKVRPLNHPGPLLVEYSLLNDFVDLGFDVDIERDNKSLYSVPQLVEGLARYGERKSDLSRAYLPALDRAMDIAMRDFGGDGSLKPFELSPELQRFTKQEKSAGLPSMGNKGDNFENDLKRAGRIIAGKTAPFPCVAFHRVSHGPDGPKTRLVWGYPQSMFLVESMFAPELILRYLSSSTPMAFGLTKVQIGASLTQIENSGVRYSLDFSGFDSSVPSGIIHFAFRVLRSHFAEWDEFHEKAWNRLIGYFINTPIMMPDQSIWRKHGGIPSGSYFTQLIDSIVNYVAVQYAFLRSLGQPVEVEKVKVLGDDSVIGHGTYIPIERLAKYFGELGLRLNERKTKISRFGKEPVEFLGHIWYHGIADRPVEELVKRLVFPEKPSGIRDTKTRRYVRLLSFVGDARSMHGIIDMLSSYDGPQVFLKYMAHAYRGGYDDDLVRYRIDNSLLPGWTQHLEELGTMELPTVGDLVYSSYVTALLN